MRCCTLSLLPVMRKSAYFRKPPCECRIRTKASVADPASLREVDIELMRRLSPRVNVIPVVGKADTLTPTELRQFKKRVRNASFDCLPPSPSSRGLLLHP